MISIPDVLYRGDSDKYGSRKLRQTIHHGQLQTNLINGGVGRIIYETPILSLLVNHVSPGWALTHFLSFSANISIAYHYGLNDEKFKIENPEDNCISGDGDDYDFALLTLHKNLVNWIELESGVFEGKFRPSLNEFARHGIDYRILLYDVYKILTNANEDQYSTAISNSKRDSEWLLLPATNKQFNFGKEEYSGILDTNCITYQKIKWLGQT